MSVWFIAAIIIAATGYIVFSALTMLFYRKARQPAWIAWIPIYNVWRIGSFDVEVPTTQFQPKPVAVTPTAQPVNVPSVVKAPPGPPHRRLVPQPQEATPPNRAAVRTVFEPPGIPPSKAPTPPMPPDFSEARHADRNLKTPVPPVVNERTPVGAAETHPMRPTVQSPMDDSTQLIARKRRRGVLTTPDGQNVALSKSVVIIGRNLSGMSADSDTQLVTVHDETRTISKKHAQLRWQSDTWVITDLGSTNGVYVVEPDGAETELVGTRAVKGKFMLGDAIFLLEAEPDSKTTAG